MQGAITTQCCYSYTSMITCRTTNHVHRFTRVQQLVDTHSDILHNVQICIESSKLLNFDQRKCCNYESQTKYLPTTSCAVLIMYVQLMRHSKYFVWNWQFRSSSFQLLKHYKVQLELVLSISWVYFDSARAASASSSSSAVAASALMQDSFRLSRRLGSSLSPLTDRLFPPDANRWRRLAVIEPIESPDACRDFILDPSGAEGRRLRSTSAGSRTTITGHVAWLTR